MCPAPSPLLLFAHGAGAGSAHPWMQGWVDRLRAVGEVVAFDYPYIQAGRRAPDRMPKLLAAHAEALNQARADHPGPVVLVGKSMGSRVGVTLAASDALRGVVRGVVCLGYPLQPPGRPDKIRPEPLQQCPVPLLLVQGTRDRFAPADVRDEVYGGLEHATVHLVEDGDHGLLLGKRYQKRTGVLQEHADAAVLEAIAAFVARVCP